MSGYSSIRIKKGRIMEKAARSGWLKRAWAFAIVAAMCAVVMGIAGCGGSNAAPASSGSGSSSSAASAEASGSASAPASAEASASGDTVSFTDSAGRTVEIPANIERVAVTGPISQMFMLTFAPQKMVGLSNELSDTEMKYVGKEYGALPVYGQIYGGKGDFNKEAVASADPQLILDIGEAKKSIVEDLDEIQTATGIPCVHVEATIDTYDKAYTMMGELLGEPDRAKELADYCADAYATTKAGLNGVTEANRVQALYLLGDAGLNAMPNGSFQGTVFDWVVDNPAVIENAGGSGLGAEVSFEQIAMWDPPMIVFGPQSVYDKVADDPSWQTLKAVKDGNYYEVPGEPYNWLSSPPGVNQILGMQWFARLCYPDNFDNGIEDVVKGYYKTMYDYELTDDECSALVKSSVPKQ